MVNVIIKGIKKGRTFNIAAIKAGVTLKSDGGIYLQLRDQQLSKAFQELFKKQGGGIKNGKEI